MSSYGLETTEADDGADVRVELSGELDLTSARELEERLAASAPPEARLVLDLNRVSFLDSAALHVLFKLARGRGRDRLVVLVAPDGRIASTLAIVGFGHAATLVGDLDSLPPADAG